MNISGLGRSKEVLQANVEKRNSGKGFDKVMQEAITTISQIQNEADKAVKDLASGGELTQAIVAMEKADMSFQLMVEVRNKLLSAYEEIMRMQV
ncbi:MAG: flagellar hook-basal body complex protein FliE [Nitrospirae bacterium RBG_13_43_8]|nr:MAG: flagellar hook-basal body complex protein FliE [Nitrospirae bacterium RBG_13_43_8]